jgi:hypothetical protein
MYLGPDIVAPVASAIAAAIGALLMFWRRIVTGIRGLGRGIARRFGRT